MIKYEENKHGISKDGHTMFDQDIVMELNRKAYLEDRVLLLERACGLQKVTVVSKPALLDSLLSYDDWEHEKDKLYEFVGKYANKRVDVFEQYGDYFILEDNNVVMPLDSFIK